MMIKHLHQGRLILDQRSQRYSPLLVAEKVVEKVQFNKLVTSLVVVTQTCDPLAQERHVALELVQFAEVGLILLGSHHWLLGGASNAASGR